MQAVDLLDGRDEGCFGLGEMKKEGSEDGIKSLHKVMRVLDCFSVEDDVLSVGDIARRLSIPQSTAHRLLSSMRQAGLLEQDKRRGGYRLGLKLFSLGSTVLASMELHRISISAMEELHRITRMSVHLAVFDGQGVLVVRKIGSARELSTSLNLMERAPAHCTGVGKAILAFQPTATLDSLFRSPPVRYNGNTIVERAAFEREMAATSARGYAVDDEEHNIGIRCVAAPIFNEAGTAFAAISVSGTAWDLMPDAVAEISRTVKLHADALSARLGFAGLPSAKASGEHGKPT
ncbi:IclR family transcriptional regulator [Boseongicola sp. H5]|uniref:IclR family transcriptional regulator n=1 Tax=Boseongicola sp. H5 TaxID=2763261 RepID=UPI001B04A04C|nr:IclR family transcriptional regulator [Boseongicola sp. H5]MBO6921969.1 IclR family transcriptional regulator [Roseicyclus sp.]